MLMEGGYDVEPAENIPSKYECQLCMLILRQPVQTLCGHRFCQNCLNSLFRQQGKNIICPIDRQVIEKTTLFIDRAYEREILDIQVKCSNRKSGCNWTGELRELENHVVNRCMKEVISCQNCNCNIRVFRGDLDYHMSNDCPYRSSKCIHCNDEFMYCNLEDHLKSCQWFPLICYNNCGAIEIPRIKMQKHLSECPLAVVTCAFENIGCKIKFQRKVEKKHLEEYTQTHLQLAAMKITKLDKTSQDQEKMIKSLKKQCEEQGKGKKLEGKCQEHQSKKKGPKQSLEGLQGKPKRSKWNEEEL